MTKDQGPRTRDLERCLGRLPEPLRRVLLWRHRDHLSFAAIAGRLGRPLAEAQAVWCRALEALSREMESDDESPGADAG